jgi:hypothetical protein
MLLDMLEKGVPEGKAFAVVGQAQTPVQLGETLLLDILAWELERQ